jgi:hypothetical protein
MVPEPFSEGRPIPWEAPLRDASKQRLLDDIRKSQETKTFNTREVTDRGIERSGLTLVDFVHIEKHLSRN